MTGRLFSVLENFTIDRDMEERTVCKRTLEQHVFVIAAGLRDTEGSLCSCWVSKAQSCFKKHPVFFPVTFFSILHQKRRRLVRTRAAVGREGAPAPPAAATLRATAWSSVFLLPPWETVQAPTAWNRGQQCKFSSTHSFWSIRFKGRDPGPSCQATVIPSQSAGFLGHQTITFPL